VTNMEGRTATIYETEIVNYMHTWGLTSVTRRRVRGLRALGELTGFPAHLGLVHCEVKTGHNAALAGDEQVRYWMENAERRCCEDGLDHVLLVVKRRRVADVRYQWAITNEYGTYGSVLVRLTLEDWCKRHVSGHTTGLVRLPAREGQAANG
jgi:hypothetical protein